MILFTLLALASSQALAEQVFSEATAREAMAKAVHFFRTEVSAQGLYLWRYSADLKLREGEGKGAPTTGWVQPPGTPSVGLAYLKAYELTREPYLLEAAVETGKALVGGQLLSGGWDYRIDLNPKAREGIAYRKPPGDPKGKNVSTLDDNTTQEALRFLMRLDKTLSFKDAEIHECVSYALGALLKAQYPNGAWPQRFDAPPNPGDFPVTAASYPESWPRQFPNTKYMGYYTFNDNSISDALEVMLDAWEIYGDARYRDAALKAGDFMLLAQMPAPQPGWAQQYNVEMHPVWARKFEPPAITGHESQTIMLTLIELAHRTKESRFLETVPEALTYFRASLLPDGRLARFYELQTNKPLYFTKDYVLTYDDSDVPTHYGFKSTSNLDKIEERYAEVKEGKPQETLDPSPAALAPEAAASMDERGAWVSKKTLRNYPEAGELEVIDSAVFAQNLAALAEWINDTTGSKE